MRTEGPSPVSMPRDPTNPRGRRGQQGRAGKGGSKKEKEKELAPLRGTEEGLPPDAGGLEPPQEPESGKEIGRLVDIRI